MIDKWKGALLGFAIGDTMGGTTEFMSKEKIQAKYGRVTNIIGGGVWNLAPGEITDDTSMTICVATGIIENPKDPIEGIGNHFLSWYSTNPKDVGVIIETVFENYKGNWKDSAKEAHKYLDEKSAGNGSLMRCLPIALAYPDLDQMEMMTREISEMTHYDDLAAEACVIYNKIANKIINGKNLLLSITEVIKSTRYEHLLSQKPNCPPNGFVVNTLEWALYWLISSVNFVDALLGPVNEGGDTDTIAAITGGLAGLYWGYEEIPKYLSEQILVKNQLGLLSQQLYDLFRKKVMDTQKFVYRRDTFD